jgi:hypothetical protein
MKVSRVVAFEAIRNWRQSIDFMKDEVRFFQLLIDRNFDQLILQGQEDFAEGMISELNSLSFSDLDVSLESLNQLVDSIDEDEEVLDHDSLDKYLEARKTFDRFESDFRKIKAIIFEHVESLKSKD